MQTLMLAAALFAATTSTQAQTPGPTDVLLIGDSHTVGTFGRRLDQWIRSELKDGATLASYGACSSRISHWYTDFRSPACYIARPRGYDPTRDSRIEAFRRGRLPRIPTTPNFEDLLREDRPALTIVELGANQLGFDRAYHRQWIRQMVEDIRTYSHHCVWIGPPNGPNKPASHLEAFYEVLAEEAGDTCSIVDSRIVTHTIRGCVSRTTGVTGICRNPHFDQLTGPAREAGLEMIDKWVSLASESILPLLNRE